jgi:hypothetical protein
MIYEHAKSLIIEYFKKHKNQYRIQNNLESMTEHISIWYGRNEKFSIDMLIDRYEIEYIHSSHGRDKERKIPLKCVAPYMLRRLLDRQVVFIDNKKVVDIFYPRLKILKKND